MNSLRPVILLAVAGACFAIPAVAHHSHANYDQTVFTHLEGTVREIRWSNPHMWVYLEVQDETDKPSLWALEGGSVAHVLGHGWTREDITVGDTIRVSCHQLKDGENGCLVRFLTAGDNIERPFD